MRIPEVDIPYRKYVLDNGLTLIVHEDHKAPIVAVDTWYHVGSKNENPGKTGFAHLFEHLMFSGSVHYDDEYFRPFEEAGATDMNGTTSEDRTNFFQNVPTPALDLALWMESDRMGHLLGAINQDKLDEQRGVVKNEKRQRENTPYGKVWQLLPANTYPHGHPYSWTVIGSMEDLDAASLDDVHQWFRDYYGAANAVLVVAGDVEPEAVRARVEHYFGSIPSGPPVIRQKQWIARRTGEHRQVMQDQVPQARIYKVWNVPPKMTDALTDLEIAGALLAGSKNSRLYQRLVYRDQLATDVVAGVNDREIGSQFMIWATARPDVALEQVEATLDEELARFLLDGPDADELERVRTQIAADFIRGTEHIGGFGGKADILAHSEIYGASPDAYKREQARLRQISSEDIRARAHEWLRDGAYILEVHPQVEYTTLPDTVERSRPPSIEQLPDLQLPAVERATLANGLKVVFAHRSAVPVVELRLIVDAGYAADAGAAPGTANMALSMLDEGTQRRSSLQLDRELERLGAHFSADSTLDSSSINLSTLTSELDAALDLYADIIRHPAFPEHELERLKRQTLARIQQEKSRPTSLALRVLPPLLYGHAHAYSQPLTGSGTQASVSALSVDDMRTFHQHWIRPDNATLIVVGDTRLESILPRLEKHLGGWRAPEQPLPEKNLATSKNPAAPRVLLMDRPGAEQSVIVCGRVAPPRNHPDHIPMLTLNAILGGMFTSRLNMNLRETKHWSYGAHSMLMDARGQQPFLVFAPIEREYTAAAMLEIRNDIDTIRGERPPSDAELTTAQKNLTLKLPGEHETAAEVAETLAESVVFELPDDYYNNFVTRVRALSHDDLARAGERLFQPGALTWVVVGDLSKIEQSVRTLDLGETQVLDADGHVLR